MLRPALTLVLSVAVIASAFGTPRSAHADEASPAPTVLIAELANGGAGSDSDSFFELRNYGTDAVDLTGWQVFRCSAQGLRANVGRPEADLTGVVLEPGGILTVSRVGMPGDLHFTEPYALTGFGLYLEDPLDRLVDAVGVYPSEPWPTHSECTHGQNLPNRLDFAQNESWQRVAVTGDLRTDFIVAPATIGAANRTESRERADVPVLISEVASWGPAGDRDEFVELVNLSDAAVPIGGWQLYRCTAAGRSTPETVELVVAEGTVLEGGDRFVVGGAHFDGPVDARLSESLANISFGVMLRTASGLLVDRIAVSAHDDSACQDADAKLAPTMDAVAGQSYQRAGAGFVVAERTPGAPNADHDEPIPTGVQYTGAGVAVSELATDPADGPAGSVQHNFVELANYGQYPVDISGWVIRRCQADGARALDPQAVVPDGTVLEPGQTWLAARSGTPAATDADALFDTSFNFLGTGVRVEDPLGRLVDAIGVYATNEMDSSNVIASPCTSGRALTVYQPDRLLGESFRRAQFTGVNADDFLAAAATPGALDDLHFSAPTARVPSVEPAALSAPGRARVAHEELPVAAAPVIEAWSGVSPAPLAARVGEAEVALDPAAPGSTADDGWGLPYQRFVLDAAGLSPGDLVGWSGSTVERGEVQLSVWNGQQWRLLDAGGSGTLAGRLEPTDVRDGRVELLVQDGPRVAPTVTTERDGAFESPGDYDFALTHITDTQYLSESYPEVYAQLVSWVADNATERKVAFAVHTGDLIQNWVDPDQNEERARVEFERASAIQSILDESAVPNIVLPGNHDNKRGVTNDLFNEYFPPSRYAGTDWFVESIAPGDLSASYSTFEQSGARFLVLTLPYGYGEEHIAWAETVVAEHPQFNVVIATHEHVTAETEEAPAHRSGNSRWNSRAQELWDRVIAPNRSVVLVLSGHFHGLGQLVTQNAGGIPGHTVVELLADYQEFRTHTGERATGFFRLLQVDIDGGAIAVDTRSVRLAASYSQDYDYRQFVPENGSSSAPSNSRPWNVVDTGLQERYSEEDDEFTAWVSLQHPKLVATTAVLVG